MRVFLAILFSALSLRAATVTELTSYGITLQFDSSVEVGQFVTTNNWYIVGPATVTNISPAWTGTNNGWMINPGYQSLHGFASHIGNYDASLRPALPFTINSNCTLVCTIGTGRSAQNDTAIQTAVAFTFLTAAPASPSITFRPAVYGNDKTLYTLNDLQTNLLPSLASTYITNKQTLAQTKNEHDDSFWLDFNASSARQFRPASVMSDYNPENNQLVYDGIASILLDDTQAAKAEAVRYIAQWCLDRARIVELGYRDPGTGHNPGHRIPAIVGALLFNLSSVITVCNAATNFHEDEYIVYGDGAQRPLWGQKSATTESQYWGYVVNGSGSRSHKDPYGYIDGGAADRSGYLTITAQTLKSMATIGRVWTNTQAGFGSNSWWSLSTFAERWVTNGMWYSGDPAAADDGIWANYGITYGPSGSGSYIAGSGRFNAYHQSNLDGGASTSQFIRELWNAHATSTNLPSPEVSSVTISANGSTWTVTFTEAAYSGTGGAGGFSATMNGQSVGLSRTAGDGTAEWTFTATRTIYAGETGTLDFTNPGDGAQDIDGNDVANATGKVVVNNSSQQQPAPSGAARNLVKYKGIKVGP